jgi:hypothetical protein
LRPKLRREITDGNSTQYYRVALTPGTYWIAANALFDMAMHSGNCNICALANDPNIDYETQGAVSDPNGVPSQNFADHQGSMPMRLQPVEMYITLEEP